VTGGAPVDRPEPGKRDAGMKRIILINLVFIVMLTLCLAPHTVSADENEGRLLTTEEKEFVSDIRSRIAMARSRVDEYNELVNHAEEFRKVIILDTPYHVFGDRNRWNDCAFGIVPNTMYDIADEWNAEVCSQFADISSTYGTFHENPHDLGNLMVGLTFIHTTIDSIDASLASIEEMTNQRVTQLDIAREAAKEVKKVVKGDTRDTGGEKDNGGEAGSSPDKDKKDSEDSGDLFDTDCFIATAAYGTPEAGEIDTLRRFRAEFLLHNPPGRAFVAVYYAVSPPIANFISEHEVIRIAVREVFVDHLVTVMELTESWWAECPHLPRQLYN
jgi:hypothetical protein